MYIKQKTLRFTQHLNSGDEIEHRVRIIPDGFVLDYDNEASKEEFYVNTPFSSVPLAANDGDEVVVNLAALSVSPSTEGVHDVHITTADDDGNESDSLELANHAFDFSPPLAPTDGSID